MPKFTVIGICSEQRHAFHVEAKNPEQATISCLNDHDGNTSYHLVVAGVLKGFHKCVETEDAGLDMQQSHGRGITRPCSFVKQKDARRR